MPDERVDLRTRRPARERIPHVKPPNDEPTRQHQTTREVELPQSVKSQKRRSKRPARSDGLSVPWWGFVIVILLVGGLTCGMWGYALSLRGEAQLSVGPTPTPIIVVITATPTLRGDDAGVAANPTAQPAAPATEPFPPTSTSPPPNLSIQVGRNVVIDGTEGQGLAIRQGPGLNFGYFFIGQDGEIFFVEDGPREADGFVWWYIVDPADPDRAGWSAGQFMRVESEQ
ncbi:MAG: hypothetical protein ACFB51_07260 [Anaerolineae bacterium]